MSDFKIPSEYDVTKDGKVFSVSTNWRGYGVREMKQDLNSYGYPSVRIIINGKRKRITVHRLVAAKYLPPRPSSKHEIRHLDGDKTNNNISNLCWGTASDNARDRVKHGNQYYPDWNNPVLRAKMIAGIRRYHNERM